MFYCINSKQVFAEVQDFLLAHKDTSFGEMKTEEERNIFGLFQLHRQIPEYDLQLQEITPGAIVKIDGKWTQTFQVKDKVLSHEDRSRIFNNKFSDALTAHFDAVAAERQYTNHVTCLMRAGYPSPYQKEAQAFGTWMDECGAKCYVIMNQVTVGERAIPTSVKPFIDELPPMVWP